MDFLSYYREKVTEAIDRYSFTEEPRKLYEPINYALGFGGKRLRPIMVLMASDLFDGDQEKTIKPALAMEFFHNFTLIHDDIMDRSLLRRDQSTLHALYGLNSGILCGDTLLIKAYQFFEDLEPALFKKCISVFSDTGSLLCKGQQCDVDFENVQYISYDDYISMVASKTGSLCAASLKIGALIAGASEADADMLYNFGNQVGIIFQMMDDYLDVFGNEKSFGKKLGGDIYENKKTILYLLALKNADQRELKELDYWYSRKTDNVDKIYAVEKIFRRTKADKKVFQLIREYDQAALEFLDKIDRPKNKKEPLIQLKDYLLGRIS